MITENPTGALRELRIKLIELITDLGPSEQIDTAMYRESIELAVEQARGCRLIDSIDELQWAREISHEIVWGGQEHRGEVTFSETAQRFYEIQELAKKAVVEELEKSCGCGLMPSPEERNGGT